jgi:exonuclease SbcC
MYNNFPRIYSLSTIGIKQHFNADYLFHPYRTDFSGESGSGKSMVADIIQLILIGSSEFKSATDGNKHRDVKGMLLDLKGKASSRGYVFINIEVRNKNFITIGAYIESTSNVAEMFIIQNGYDWEELSPMSSPILAENLIIEDKIDTIGTLCDKFDKAQIKVFSRKKYHHILYSNNILSLDLTKDETLRTYASILRSFSRGKGFKVESESIKKFLFGDEEQNGIMQRYTEEVNNINNDFHEHKRFQEEIELIHEKETLLKVVVEKNKTFKALYSDYIIKRFNYWTTVKNTVESQLQAASKDLTQNQIEHLYIENQLQSLRIIDLGQLLEKKKKIDKNAGLSNEAISQIKNDYREIEKSKGQVETVDKWLSAHDNEIEEVKKWFKQQKQNDENKSNLSKFLNYLKSHHLLDNFEDSAWFHDFENEEQRFQIDINSLENKISNLESLSKFSDIANPESLLKWAVENLPFPISHSIESILIYFQKLDRKMSLQKPGSRYLPFPEELFKNQDIKNETALGFWLNLDGVYEYIAYSKSQVLNTDNPDSIVDPLSKLKGGIESELKILVQQKDEKIKYKELLFKFSNLQDHIILYTKKDSLINFTIDESIDITENKFEQFIALFSDKTNIYNEYNALYKQYEDILKEEASYEEQKRIIEKLEGTLFSGKKNIAIELIEKEIETEKELSLEKQQQLQNRLLKAGLQKTDLEGKYVDKTRDADQLVLLELKHKLDMEIMRLEKKTEEKSNFIASSTKELNSTQELNSEIFQLKLKLVRSAAEYSNPDDGGNNSLKNNAERAKIAYDEQLKLIIEKMSYQIDESISMGKLAHLMLPTVFESSAIDEDLIDSNIADRLTKLALDIQEIGSRKIEILSSIFNEVYKTYMAHLTKVNDIDDYLKKKNKVITGGNRAALTASKSIHYPESWLSTFRKQLANQVNNTGLFSELREEIDIDKMMIKAFQKIGGSPKVEPQDLMNPKSYFDLEFELKLENGEANSGSNGQTYTANALLCLARLSLIEEKNKKGLKIMSIDEAEGLGSNYDMLHELAKKENYQIITMAIETAGDIKAGDQYIYIMNENNLADMESYVPPLGIFSENIVEDINEYINSMPDDE